MKRKIRVVLGGINLVFGFFNPNNKKPLVVCRVGVGVFAFGGVVLV